MNGPWTDPRPPLLILTGPTAVGKTALSISLAKAVGGEIISADSMQVYKHMDIGSAKITVQEMQGVPHHLLNILEPWEDFNVVTFKRLCKAAMEEIYARRKLPILVGGTGFYIQAVLRDIAFTDNEDDPEYRRELEQFAETNGDDALHEKLRLVDAASADAIPAGNRKRVIRALEYYHLTGAPISLHNERERRRPDAYNACYFVLTDDRAVLYERIEKRVDEMMAQGLVAEVQALKDMGCRRGQTAMQGLGYKEILDYLDGLCTLEEAVERIKLETRHFAKRQLTWFRREQNVIWLDRAKYRVESDACLLETMLNAAKCKGI
ncbi:MAG: tRNA (adenosine(37)-N6)-dimethylallyltransferase MiaA, partial [Lachnospiraceae bacterium]|nr:tRNA (adenosine(37)-N6)-dimethylallyltransferase MiaA [Lachnospiraceae bacterium]